MLSDDLSETIQNGTRLLFADFGAKNEPKFIISLHEATSFLRVCIWSTFSAFRMRYCQSRWNISTDRGIRRTAIPCGRPVPTMLKYQIPPNEIAARSNMPLTGYCNRRSLPVIGLAYSYKQRFV